MNDHTSDETSEKTGSAKWIGYSRRHRPAPVNLPPGDPSVDRRKLLGMGRRALIGAATGAIVGDGIAFYAYKKAGGLNQQKFTGEELKEEALRRLDEAARDQDWTPRETVQAYQDIVTQVTNELEPMPENKKNGLLAVLFGLPPIFGALIGAGSASSPAARE